MSIWKVFTITSNNVAESTVLESKDSPFSQLGINAKDMNTEEMAITANAIYDLSALSRSTKDSGKKIQYTMRLYVKDNSGDYKQTTILANTSVALLWKTPHQAAV